MPPTLRVPLVILSLVLLLLFHCAVPAAEMKLLGSVEGRFRAVAACPGYVFLGEEPPPGEGLPPDAGRNIRIYDVEDPASPRLACAYRLPSIPIRMRVSESNLYVATLRSSENVHGDTRGTNPTLIVLDITHPTSPVLLGVYHSNDLSRLNIRGRYADVVEDHENAYKILDVSNPAAIHPIGTVKKVWAAAADSRGKYAYGLVGGSRLENSRLVVVDISDPKTASIVHEVNEAVGGSYGHDIAVSGDRVVVVWVTHSQLYAGMDVFDISAPRSPRRLGRFRFPRNYIRIQGFVVRGSLAFVSFSYRMKKAQFVGIYVMDFSDPSNPVVRDEVLFPHVEDVFVAGGQLALCGSLAFATNDDEGLQIVDISAVLRRKPQEVFLHGRLLEAAEFCANLLEGSQMVPIHEPPTDKIRY